MSDGAGHSLTAKLRRSPRTIRQVVHTQRDRMVDSGAATLAERFYRLSDRLAHLPFRREILDVPQPLVSDGMSIDIVADLAAYTQLPEGEVRDALQRRKALSFRSEWWATPPELRSDHWFY